MLERIRLLILMTISIVCGLPFRAGAEERDQGRSEWVVSIPIMRLDGFKVTEPGFGAQGNFRLFGWGKTRWSVDAEADYFPGIHSYSAAQKRFPYWLAPEEVSKSQFVLGLRTGMLWRRAELFGKFRPGLFRFSEFTLHKENSLCAAVYPPPEGCFTNRAKARPAIDWGGGVVLPAGKRWILRFDAGDTLVHYDLDLLSVPNIGPPDNPIINPGRAAATPYSRADWKHHIRLGVGFGIRF
jgi:hypothetical protein